MAAAMIRSRIHWLVAIVCVAASCSFRAKSGAGGCSRAACIRARSSARTASSTRRWSPASRTACSAPCDGGAAQAWTVENVGRGYYRLVHAGSSLCLDVSGGSVTAGAPIQQWTCNDLSPQIWHVEPQ